MVKAEIENGVPLPKSPKSEKVELARELYIKGGISKNDSARAVCHLDNKAGFESVEKDSAIQYIARRI